MSKYLILFHDEWQPIPEVMEAWQSWFAKVGDRFVDSGNPFTGGVEITHDGSSDLSADRGVATGYSIVSAASREDAVALLEGCPYVSSVRIYEASAM